MKFRTSVRFWCAVLSIGSLLAPGTAHAQSTYTWANSNITATPPTPLDWFTGGPNTQGTWTGGTPVSGNLNAIQFFNNAGTNLTNTGNPSAQTSNLNNGGAAFQLGTLTLSGRASATNNAKLNMTISGDALNFSAATGTINLDATNVDGDQLITYFLNTNVELGTASSGSILTISGNGNSTFNIGGVISELQAGGGSLIKNGTATVSLTNANTYTGSTTLNAGVLGLSGSGSILGTSGITFNGGTLTLTNIAAETGSGRINTNAITSNGGTLNYNNTSGANVYAETIGSVALTSGQMNFVLGTNQASTGNQTLTLSGLTRPGATNSSAVAFSAATTGPNATKNMILVSGATPTPAGEIIGPWATTGTAANNQNDYAVYDASGYVVARSTAASAQSTWSTTYAAASNYTLANPAGSVSDGVLSATRIINTLRNAATAASATANSTSEYFTLAGNSFANDDIITVSGTGGTTAGLLYYVINAGGGGAGTFQISTTPGGAAVNLTNTTAGQVSSGGLNLNGFNLDTYGVLNGSATRFNIAPGSGGVLTTPTGGGNLYLTTHGVNTNTDGAHNGISVAAPINNNGVNAVTLVKSGVGVLQLNATSNYSGGTVLNSGILWAQTDASLGDVNGDITFNGSATLLLSPNNGTSALNFTLPSTRSIIVNNGTTATIAAGRANANITINGDISGSGGVTTGRVALLSNGGVGTIYVFNLLGNNTFTGEFGVGNGGETSAGAQLGGVTVNTLADSTSPITLNFGSGAYFSLGSTATVNLSVPNRPVDLRNSNITIRNQDPNNTMTLGSVSTTTTGAKELKLGDGGAGGFITGNITNGAGTIAVSKSGSGTWTISGNMSNTGNVVINAGGTLRLSGTNTYSGQTQFSGSGAELILVGSQAASSNTTFVMNTSASTASSTIRFLDNTGGINGSNATFAGTYRLQSNNTAGITNNFFVGNDSNANGGTGSGTTTGSTLILGTMDWSTVANGTTNVGNIAIQGSNGYRLQINNVVMFNGSGHTAGNTNNTNFIPTTANVTLGSVTMAAGNAVNGVIPFLVLGGTSSDNRITGTISNASDVGTSLRPVNLTKSSTSTWTLSGTNTYSGATSVAGGTLIGTNAVQSFGTNLSGITIAAAGTLSLRNDSTVSFTNGTSAYNIANSASGATINVDRVSGTGSNTITVGNLTTTSTAGSWGLNFTGSNGVSLSAGTLNTPVSTATATHTITNNIAGGGSLTLASVNNQATTVASPDLVFTGTGNTTVTGAITQTLATMDLIKNGNGILTLGGANTYTGATTVNAGTLLVNGDNSLATGAVTVNAGATLGGDGIVGGAVTFVGASFLSPGNSPGQLTVPSLALAALTTTTMELGGTTLGALYDNITVNTNGSLGYNGVLDVVNFGAYDMDAGSFTYDLFSFSGTTTPSGSFGSVFVNSIALTNNAGVWTGSNGPDVEYTFTQSTGDLIISVVPEPTTMAILGAGVALLGLQVARRRRRIG